MPSYVTPARIRWPRSNITGAEPDTLAPGSMAVNWADKKVFVGGPNALPVRFSQWLEEWEQVRTYRVGDFVLERGEIWRARVNVTYGFPFDDNQWQRMTDATRSASSEPYATGIISGGEVTAAADPAQVIIGAGIGIIVNNDGPQNISVLVVTWADITFVPAPKASGHDVIGINIGGSVASTPVETYDAEWRRTNIELAGLTWIANVILNIAPGSVRVGGTSETLKDAYYEGGGAYKTRGLTIAPAGGLTVAMSAGRTFSTVDKWRTAPLSPNTWEVPAASPMAFSRVSQAGIIAPAVTDFDPTMWDNGGVLSPVAPGEATIQYLIGDPSMTQVYVEYGQTLYPDIATAKGAAATDWDTFTPLAPPLQWVVLASVVTEGGTADLNDGVVAILPAGRGSNPFEGAAAIEDSQYYFLDGSRALTGDMTGAGFLIDNVELDGGDIL